MFETPERFNEYMRVHHPEFPKRRAFFVETDTRLSVYTQWGDRVGDDLRHEATHGHLHSVVRNIAAVARRGAGQVQRDSALPRGREPRVDAVHRPAAEAEHLAARLARLERIAPDRDMSLAEYAEAWAWVRFCMDTEPEHLEALRAYLTDLRRGGPVEPLSSASAAADAESRVRTDRALRAVGAQ